MDYEQRLKAAAHFIILDDHSSRIEESPPLNSGDLGISATLKPHQLEGVAWLIRRYALGVNVILVVLCPLSVTDGWMAEYSNFCPTIRVLRYFGDKGVRRDLRRTAFEYVKQQLSLSDVGSVLPFDVLLTTYDIALLDQDFLCQIPWQYAVIDEAQRLKNPSSVLYNVLEQRFVMPRRLLMTGTPIQNNLSELWALMHFCMPSIFGALEQFLATFKEAGISSAGHDAAKVMEQFKTLKYVLRAFMLRRTKSMLVERGILRLPPLTEITVMSPLVPLQKKVYMSILRRELPALLMLSSGASSHQSLQNIVIQLRKACSHPYLFNGIEPEPYEEGEHLVQASGKLIILDKLLQKLHATGHRVLLFAQMTHTLDILQDFLELRKYSYERLDGSVRAEERFAAIRSFSQQPVKSTSKIQDNQPSAFVFMISTRAGGVGLNLVAADTVIFYEQDWNPQVDKQALQRAHRIGQVNHVLSINLVSAHSVEEVIMRRAERKLQLSDNVVGREFANGEGKEAGAEAGDLQSLIFGLHMFDPMDIDESSGGVNMVELNAMAEKLIEIRVHEPLDKRDENDRKFEINPTDLLNGDDISMRSSSASISFDPGLDESSYLSWIEKFKEASQSIDGSSLDPGRKKNPSGARHQKHEGARHQKHEADHKKAEEKKLLKWEALGYNSLAVKDPICVIDNDIISDTGSVQFVYGDCTKPSKVCPSEPAIIFSCVDNSGNWGHGGMFDALANLTGSIPDAYQRAFECGDLHLGDLHLVKIDEVNDENNMDANNPQWVALAVVQSYNPRRKVPRSNISIPDLEQCLLKASFAAAQNSASIHMPRIGYQDGSDRSEWYAVERLLRKYASIYGIKIFVYYFRRPS